jgi:hypothetical protein
MYKTFSLLLLNLESSGKVDIKLTTHILTIMNNVEINVRMHISLQHSNFLLAIYPEVGLLDHIKILISTVENFHVAFHSHCTSLHFPPTMYNGSFSRHPWEHLLSFVFF